MLAEDFMESYNQRINSKLRSSLSMNCVNVNEKSNLVYLSSITRKRSAAAAAAAAAAPSSPTTTHGKTRSDTDLWGSSSCCEAGHTHSELYSTSSTTAPRATSNDEQSNNNRARGGDGGGKKRVKYRFKRENMALYFAYEYVMFGLVLDRLFFWFYFLSTLLSYFITLYVFPFVMQVEKKELSSNVP